MLSDRLGVGRPWVQDGRSFAYARVSRGTTRYTASGTTKVESTNARRTGFQSLANGAIAKDPIVTSGKIAIQVMSARTCTGGGDMGCDIAVVPIFRDCFKDRG
jgi:hypothetical protein